MSKHFSALLVLVSALMVGLVIPAGAQPPPEIPAAPSVEIAGVGKLEMLPDLVDGDWVLFGKLTPGDLGAFRLTAALLYGDNGDHYQLRLTPKEAQFFLVRGGKATPLGSPGKPGALLAAGELTEISIRRDSWTLSLLLGGRLVCSAQDATLEVGNLGYALAGGRLEGALLQFIGDMGFSDDFMRGTEERSLWTPVSGRWQEESLRIDPQANTMQETKSANAFSYLGKAPQGRALTAVGYWFWSDYRLSASVRPIGNGACGLLAYYHDPENYLALRWTPRASTATDGNRLQILERVGGHERVLAETPGGFRPEQWYKLTFSLSGGWLRASLDDEELLSARNEVFRQGQGGLFVEGAEGANFDDVTLSRWGYFADSFDGSQRWDVASGKWELKGGRYTASAAGLVVGPPLSWSHCVVSADTHLEKGAAGLVMGYRDPQHYWLLRYALAGSGAKVELVQVTKGAEQVLASAPVERPTNLAARVGAEINNGLLTAQFGNTRLFRAVLPESPVGRLGLYSNGGGNWFSFAESQRVDPPPAAHITKEFLDDKEHWEMAQWATRRSPWLIPPALQVEKEGNLILRENITSPSEFGNNLWWTKAVYYGDKTVSFSIPSFGIMTGTAKVILDSRPDEKGNPVGGYTLALSTRAGTKTLALALTAGERPLGEASVEVEDQECQIDYSRFGQFLQVRVNGQLVLQAEVSE